MQTKEQIRKLVSVFIKELNTVVPGEQEFITSIESFANNEIERTVRPTAEKNFNLLREKLNEKGADIDVSSIVNNKTVIFRMNQTDYYGEIILIRNGEHDDSFAAKLKNLSSFIYNTIEYETIDGARAIRDIILDFLAIYKDPFAVVEQTSAPIEENVSDFEADVVEQNVSEVSVDTVVDETREASAGVTAEVDEEANGSGPTLKELREKQALEIEQNKLRKKQEFIDYIFGGNTNDILEVADSLMNIELLEDKSDEQIELEVNDILTRKGLNIADAYIETLVDTVLHTRLSNLRLKGNVHLGLVNVLTNKHSRIYTNVSTEFLWVLTLIVLKYDLVVRTLMHYLDFDNIDVLKDAVYHFSKFDEYKSIIAASKDGNLMRDGIRTVAGIFSKYHPNVEFYDNTMLVDNPPMMPDDWTTKLKFIDNSLCEQGYEVDYSGCAMKLSEEFILDCSSKTTRDALIEYANRDTTMLLTETLNGLKILANKKRSRVLVISPSNVVVYFLTGGQYDKRIIMHKELKQENIVELAVYLTSLKLERENFFFSF